VDLDAAHHSFWDVMWSFFLLWIWVAWLWLLILVIIDVFRRDDLSGAAKAAWTIVVLVVPFIGGLVYLISQGGRMAEERAERNWV
jgi:Phospholipase_D-nuclease N-terminal